MTTRKLKFRAWGWSKQKMTDPVDLYPSNKGREKTYYPIAWVRDDAKMDYYKSELMQYTGLKDKNGKEIYEGDILEADYRPFYLDEELLEKGIGKNGNGISHFEVKHIIYDDSAGYKLPIHCELKVVGNKFEHPELMKQQK